jgi:hypothetical protein
MMNAEFLFHPQQQMDFEPSFLIYKLSLDKHTCPTLSYCESRFQLLYIMRCTVDDLPLSTSLVMSVKAIKEYTAARANVGILKS